MQLTIFPISYNSRIDYTPNEIITLFILVHTTKQPEVRDSLRIHMQSVDNLHISTYLTIANRLIYTLYWFLIVAGDLIHITVMFCFNFFSIGV